MAGTQTGFCILEMIPRLRCHDQVRILRLVFTAAGNITDGYDLRPLHKGHLMVMKTCSIVWEDLV
jgi:hypothetical protein